MSRAAKHQLPLNSERHKVAMYSLPSCFNGCQYAKHCAGRCDHVTGVQNVSPDTCEAFDKYRNNDYGVWDPTLSTIPHRVAGARRLHLIKTKEIH